MPWSFGLCLLGWLMLFPGTALAAFFTGGDDELVMIFEILTAFALIPITMLLDISCDIAHRESSENV